LCFNCSSCQKVHQNSKGEKKIQNLICLQNDFWENGYRFAKGISDYCNFVKLLYFQIFQKMTELEEVLADLQEAYERIDQDDYYIIESEERNYKLKMELEKLKEIFTRVSKDRATVEAELEEVKTELQNYLPQLRPLCNLCQNPNKRLTSRNSTGFHGACGNILQKWQKAKARDPNIPDPVYPNY
jgi:regulator of replication initiation timing